MILKRLKLKNFRGYTNIVIDFDSNMNVIIGRNDVGKSTILEALEIFFNSEKIKIDISDLSVFNSEPIIEISCCFDVGDGKILVDATNFSTCKDEFLLNDEGFLEIKHTWDCSKGKITASSQKTYIVAMYPTKYSPPLIQEKISVLQKRYDLYKNEPIYVPETRTKSAELRKAIYAKELNEPIDLALTDIDISKEDGKKIWESISKQLPMFCLFESDRKNTDKDAEIQDPLKAVTKSVVADMENQITQMQEEVKQKVEEIGRKTIKKLSELDSSIAQNIQPKVTLKPIDSSFSFDLVSDNDIPLNKRGSGVRRLILLSYFRADAEEKLRENDNRQMIYAIEEPETSQHPDYQRMILSTLLELSEKETHQIIVTSHTPEIAKMVDVNQLIFIKKNESGIPHIEKENESKIKGIAESLGILPYAKTKTVVYVEGPNDVNFLTTINHNIPELKAIVDLSDNDFSLIPLSGGNLIDWINKDYFSESSIKEIYIVDNDVKKYITTIEEIQKEDDGRRFGWHTVLPETENYIAPELIENQFDIDLSKYKNNWSSIDIPKILLNLVKQEIKDLREREIAIKQILNKSVSKKITKETLVKMNCWNEIEDWFKKIRDINNGTYEKKKSTN
ncbi:ATP-binding protein [Ruminococcus sp. Marseille-P6503]|uniref:ATP-binding protein n=1 Tax=Ruminococcus sp. Marseille-P6503 TaxID=2364796 RepID=UPI0013DDC0F9|nr:ATP-binding protein [Ruminococcus sp. Marseille-P6503]